VINMRNDREIAEKTGVHGYSGQRLILTGVTSDLRRRVSDFGVPNLT
jgi:hypothetical protein